MYFSSFKRVVNRPFAYIIAWYVKVAGVFYVVTCIFEIRKLLLVKFGGIRRAFCGVHGLK